MLTQSIATTKRYLRYFVFFFLTRNVELRILKARNKGLFHRIYEQGIVFIHIPKVAGTSVKSAIYKDQHHECAHFTAQELHQHRQQVFDTSQKVAIVRHPMERFLSSYQFYNAGGTGSVKVNPMRYLVMPKDDDILQFAKRLQRRIGKVRLDPVLHSQASYLFNQQDNLLVDHLFRLDQMPQLEETLSQLTNQPVNIGNKNTTPNKQQYDSDLLKELEHTVYQIYQKDYELLGFKKMYA